MPLWTIAIFLFISKCGCALLSLGSPWVAHLVCPMPVVPDKSSRWNSSSMSLTLPAFLKELISPSSLITATPAES